MKYFIVAAVFILLSLFNLTTLLDFVTYNYVLLRVFLLRIELAYDEINQMEKDKNRISLMWNIKTKSNK